MHETIQISGVVEAAAAPVTEANRTKTLDMLRGFALLSILLMNIAWF